MLNDKIEEYRHSHIVGFKYAKGDIGILNRCFHDYYELYILLDGNVTYVNEHGSYLIQPYDMVIIPPHEYHCFNVNGERSQYTRYIMELHPSIFSDPVLISLVNKHIIVHLTHDSEIIQNFKRMHRYCEDKYTDDYEILAKCTAIETVTLIKYIVNDNKVELEEKTPLVLEKVLEYINDNLHKSFTLSDIANACYLSQSTLSHTFREYYGIAVMKYVQAKRLMMSDELLSSGVTPNEVYRRCGYADYSTFFRAYKQYYKHSPKKSNNSNRVSEF